MKNVNKRSVGFRTLSVIAITLLLGLAGLNRLGGMDARFFADSVPGTRAFLHYLAGDYGGAAQWYRANLALSADSQAKTSWEALRGGQYDRAEALAKRELEQYPEALPPLLTLAETALARGRTAEALEHASRALRTHADDYDALLIATVARARRNESNEAIDALKRALRQDRAERRYTVFLAALELTGDLDDLERPPLALLAHLHRYLRIYDAAHASHATGYARRAIDARDRADDGWVTVAIVHDKQGKRRRALEAFDRALAVNPANTAALLGAARLRSDRGELATEYRLLHTAFQATPDDPFVVERLHFMLTRKLGDYRQALAMEQAQVAATPGDARAWWRLGTVQVYLGDHAEALGSFDRAAAIGASWPEAHEGRGWALRELKRSPEAVAAFQRAIDIDPYRPGPLLGLASVHQRERRYPQAIAALERAWRLGARQGDQVVELCALYYETGNVSRASSCLHDVLTHDPDNIRGRGLLEHVNKSAAGRKRA